MTVNSLIVAVYDCYKIYEAEFPSMFSFTQSYPDQQALTISKPLAIDGNCSLGEIEKEAILATLNATGGNKSETARRLGITRKTLHNKLKSYGV